MWWADAIKFIRICISSLIIQSAWVRFRTQTHNKKRVFGGKTWNGFVIVKSLGKYEQWYVVIPAITVARATY